MFDPIKSDYMVDGEAIDGETIIRLRPLIEEEVRESIHEFHHTKLYWNLKDDADGVWVYQLHFYYEADVDETLPEV